MITIIRISGYLLLIGSMLLSGCSYTEKIKDGKTAYERKRYFQAAEMLEDEFRAARSSMEKMSTAFLLGESHLKFGDVRSAAEWFKIAYEGGYGSGALVQYAHCLKQLEEYEAAANAYYQAGEEIGDRITYRREMAACRQALEWKQDEAYSPYVIKPLSGINTSVSEYAAFPINDHQIAFTSDRESSTGDFIYAWSGNDFSDIFLADLRTGSVKPYAEQINVDANDGTMVLTPDGEGMVFCRCFSREEYDLHCKLMWSSRSGSGWAKPEIMPFVKDGVNYRHPAFNATGDVLVFSANLEESTNDYDLYASRLVDGIWQQPESLGASINTQGREGFPFMHFDTLYFASDYGGMGGLDIYSAYVMPDGQWSIRQNLKAPINSGFDDFAFAVNTYAGTTDSVLQTGYFTSNRGGGAGQDDLYGYEKRRFFPEKEPEPEEEFLYELVLDLRVFQRQYEDPEDPDSKVLMRVPLADAAIEVLQDGAPFSQTGSNRYGIMSLELDPNHDYEFFVSHPGFFSNQLFFSTTNLPIDSTKRVQKYEERILLEKIFYDKEIVLEDIYYDLDESFIRADAEPTLNELAELLKLNPDIRIQLSSHTDCRADDDYNQTLSQARAQSAVAYLIAKGIDTQRLVAIGYGESRLAIDCVCEECTEEQHQINRRTTFKVIQ